MAALRSRALVRKVSASLRDSFSKVSIGLELPPVFRPVRRTSTIHRLPLVSAGLLSLLPLYTAIATCRLKAVLVGKCNPKVSNPSTNPNGERRDNPKGAIAKCAKMKDAKLNGVKVKCPEMRTYEKKKPGCENPSKISSKEPRAKDLKKIPRNNVRGNKKVIPKAWMPKGMLTRQETSEAYEPKSKKPSTKKDSRNEKPRLSHFEVGECSGTKDEMGKYIEESEVSETEELEMLSEHEMLRRMKRKPKTKEKTYRDAVCSGCNPK